ncbi:MAG TPA: ribosome maturation factor RimM [Psychrobacter sp.]|uniref:Ribosome maturation factor RimM n=1 Tax=Psychrobacter pasteurii TaxID=1945520 RepID=A0A1R4EHV1_9GAMM|nr:ribosome maturation factor RimM [Psychrobacter pasteurii]SJM38101.1 Ribosome maturation factor RimM [Psychrobacter pasteurii]HAO59394.1 ribosome maturation factor RimM [Psychrobacter sp.]HJH09254.1 ribosome maturation factor RimM [Psychrobacter pasteurii]
MTTPNADSLMKIGQLKKPYGIKGWLWVFSETEEREAIFSYSPWWMKTATGFKPLTVTDWRKQGSGIVAQFEQVPDRNVAETMNGVSIWIDKDSLPETEEDEYYWSDLVGLSVINKQQECLGTIKELFETGAHPIMKVVPSKDSIDDEPRMIPWHKQTVDVVDLAAGQMIVDWERDF